MLSLSLSLHSNSFDIMSQFDVTFSPVMTDASDLLPQPLSRAPEMWSADYSRCHYNVFQWRSLVRYHAPEVSESTCSQLAVMLAACSTILAARLADVGSGSFPRGLWLKSDEIGTLM